MLPASKTSSMNSSPRKIPAQKPSSPSKRAKMTPHRSKSVDESAFMSPFAKSPGGGQQAKLKKASSNAESNSSPVKKKKQSNVAPRRAKSSDGAAFANVPTPVVKLDDIRSMKVKQLKQGLTALNVSSDGAMEKEDLVQKLFTKSKKSPADKAAVSAIVRKATAANNNGQQISNTNDPMSGNKRTTTFPTKPTKPSKWDPKGPPEVNMLRRERFIPENKNSIWVYQQTAKRKDVSSQGHVGKSATWSVPDYRYDKSASQAANARPIELWMFYDDDPKEIDERVLRNNPKQGCWGYSPRVELKNYRKEGIIRPKDDGAVIAHTDLIVVPPNEKPPRGMQTMGIWVQPVLKRDTSELGDGGSGFMEVSDQIEADPDVAYAVGGQWKLLGVQDEIIRSKDLNTTRGTGPDREYQIYVRTTWDNQKYGPYTCLPSTRVLQVKENFVSKKLQIPLDDQRMSFNGSPTTDSKTLVGSGVRNGDILDLGPMDVYVRKRDGKKFLFEGLHPDTTVQDLKNLAEPKVKIPVTEQRMNFKEEPLKNNRAPLHTYGVKHRDVIDLEGMIIFVIPLDEYGGRGAKQELEVEPDFPIKQIKSMVKNRIKMPVSQQRLCHQKRELKGRDNSTLQDNSIKHLDTLTMIKDVPKQAPTSVPSPKKSPVKKDPHRRVPSSTIPKDPPEVFVKDPTNPNRTFPVPLDPKDDVPKLKEKVGTKINKPPKDFDLVDDDTDKPIDPRRPPSPGTTLRVQDKPIREAPTPKKPMKPGKVFVLDPKTNKIYPVPVDPNNFDEPKFKDKVGDRLNQPPENFDVVDDKGQPVDSQNPPIPGTTVSVKEHNPTVPVNVPGKKDPVHVPIKPDDTIEDVKDKLPSDFPKEHIKLVDPETGDEPRDTDRPVPNKPLTMPQPTVPVKVPGKKNPVHVPIKPDDTIEDVKDKLPSSFPKEHIKLVDPETGDEPKDTDRPVPHKPLTMTDPEVPVHNVPGEQDPVHVPVKPKDTIKDIKKKLAEPSGMPPEDIRLVDPETGDEPKDTDRPEPTKPLEMVNPEVTVNNVPGTKDPVNVPIKPDDTIKDVKKKLPIPKGFPKKHINLVDDEGVPLPDDAKPRPGQVLSVDPPEVEVKTPKGKVKLPLLPKQTIEDLKDILEDKTGIPKDKQHIFNDDDKPLPDDAKPFKVGIEPGSKLEMKEIPEITVKAPNGRAFPFLIDPEEDKPRKDPKKPGRYRMGPLNTIGDIKDVLEEEDGIPKDKHHIFVPGDDKPLPNNSRLNKIGITPDKKLEMKEIPEITVKTPNGRAFPFLIDPEEQPKGEPNKPGRYRLTPTGTIGDIKDVLEDETGIPKSRQQVFLPSSDKPLKNSDRISKTNIKPGAKLEMREIPEIEVTAPNGRTFFLVVDPDADPRKKHEDGRFRLKPSNTLCDLKDLIEEIEDVPLNKTRVFIFDAEMNNPLDKTPLGKVGLQPGSKIEFMPPDPLDIPIQYNGRTFHVYVDPEDNVAKLKRKAAKMGIPIDKLRLVDLDGEEMIDEEPLEKYNLRNGVLVPELPEIKITLPNARKIVLSIMPAKTISEIKDIIEEKTGTPKAQQRLFYLDSELDDGKPFSKTKLMHGDILKMEIEADNIVEFKTCDGRTFILDIEPEDTIKDVKRKLRKKIGFPLGGIRLGDLEVPDDDNAIFLDWLPKKRTAALTIDPPQVEVELPGMDKVQLTLMPAMTMRDVKNLIEEKVPDYKAKKQSRMFFFDNDKSIDDDTPISKLKLEKGMKLEIRDFEIKVVHYNGETATLNVMTTDYIDDVKKKIKKALRVPVDEQYLAFKDRPIPEDLTLKEIGLGMNDIINLEAMQITVIMPSGKKTVFKVDLEDTIASLKKKILRKTKTPVDVQCIISGSTEFKNQQTLKRCMIRHRDTLKMERFCVSVMDWEQETTVFDELSPMDSIAKIKRTILDTKDVPASMLKLLHDGYAVPDKGSLESLGIEHKSVLVLLDPADVDLSLPESEQMALRKFKVKKFKNSDKDIWPVVPDWSKRIFFFDNDDSVGDSYVEVTLMHWEGTQFKLKVKLGKKLDYLKERIAKAEGIPAKKQYITFNGKKLDRRRSLRQQGIKHKSILVLEGKREINLDLPDSQKITLDTLPVKIQGSFEVIVRHWSKKEYKMQCGPTDYLDDLKATIDKQLFLPVDHQRLTFNGKEVDETESLISQGIFQGSMLVLEQMEIDVETPTGKKLRLTVDADDTIRDIKKMVFKKDRTPVNVQCIMFGGEELPDKKTLMDCGIEHDDELTIQEFSISIMHWSGELFTVAGVVPTDSVQDLKSKVQKVRSVPKKKQVLKLQGNVLSNKKTLKDEGIHHKSVLILEEAPH